MPQIIENFFENILFRYESCSCDCVEDIEHITPGKEPVHSYKLQALPNEKKLFGYAAKKGLVRIAINGTIEDANVLGTLIALPNKPQWELTNFLKNNGFLFPVNTETYEAFDETSLYGIIDRLRMTVELMTAANEVRKDYQKILKLTLSLLFAPDVTLKTDSMSKKYHSCHHSYIDLLKNPPVQLSQEHREQEFNGNIFTVIDSIHSNSQLIVSEYNDIIGGYSSVPGFDDHIFKNITLMYMNGNDSGTNRLITEFLFHYFHDVGMLNFSNDFSYYAEPNMANFTPEMKDALIKIAKFIIGEEINANLDGIHPVYDSKTMTPSWKVDSLLCAAYFSIFYLKPDLELYRPCDNPRCGRYFLVKTTSTRNRFCSQECCNRVTQDRYRKRKREKEENK
ncbi:CGNR zinc finger domain-containing protein [Desulfotomaculum sp. OF05-3]|jgi:hypothetical protein|uniref:CGNR zinc finger domain-containing protein n=1 Tax=Desulfotomaculum sp. OF05-3 TaxID=2305243 RepID=UPI000E428A37|nr:CGNR zinc finger domain-containing protein [Desulfotomaculum sp. OF05-3]RGE13813.1 CGNR zinc finger domain-containing protein [Desulfotomaculum sp. OF05-3]